MSRISSVTFLELIFAIIILTIIVIGIVNIDYFSNFYATSSARKAKLQNEVSLVIDHMNKQISKAIGNEIINGSDTVVIDDTSSPNSVVLKVYIDASGNGKREDPVNDPLASEDHWIAYRLDTSGNVNNRYKILFCGRCKNDNCNFNQCMDNPVPGQDGEVIGYNIASFNPVKPQNALGQLNNNSMTVNLQSCWDPSAGPSPDNPCVSMSSQINMPAVSTN